MSNRENKIDLFDEIELLKEEWFKEINVKKQEIVSGKYYPSEYRIELARRIYECGYRAEILGYLEVAVEQYRRSTFLVNDIEKIMKSNEYQLKSLHHCHGTSDTSYDGQYDVLNNESRIQNSSDCHSTILQLPDELLLHIMRWVVGANLDLYTLVLLGLVCHKFHSLSTDEQLWRLISLRLWPNCTNNDLHHFGGSWITMVKTRPHLLFHGCYLGSTSYVRKGEATVNTVTVPFLLVRYFRVFRFRADGSVVMVTSAQDPQDIIRLISALDQNIHISKLGPLVGNHSIAIGHYTINGDMINVNMIRSSDINSLIATIKRARKPLVDDSVKHHLEMTFQMKSSKRRPNTVLSWRSFSLTLVVRNEVSVTHFDIGSDKFPTVVFSRVREFSSRLSQEHL